MTAPVADPLARWRRPAAMAAMGLISAVGAFLPWIEILGVKRSGVEDGRDGWFFVGLGVLSICLAAAPWNKVFEGILLLGSGLLLVAALYDFWTIRDATRPLGGSPGAGLVLCSGATAVLTVIFFSKADDRWAAVCVVVVAAVAVVAFHSVGFDIGPWKGSGTSASAAPAETTIAADETLAADDVGVSDCGAPLEIEPESVAFTCGDGGYGIMNMTWMSWGDDVAVGEGDLFTSTRPSVDGTSRVQFSAYSIDTCPDGQRVYTRMTISYLDHQKPDPEEEPLPCGDSIDRPTYLNP